MPTLELYDYDPLVSYGSSGGIVLISEAGIVSNRDGYEVMQGLFLYIFLFSSAGTARVAVAVRDLRNKTKVIHTQKKKRKGRSMFLEHGEDIPSCFLGFYIHFGFSGD